MARLLAALLCLTCARAPVGVAAEPAAYDVALAPQKATDASAQAASAQEASTLAQFLRDRAHHHLATPSGGAVVFVASKYGLGNNLMGLSAAVLVAAATGRRVKVAGGRNSVEWLWRDFFELPEEDWIDDATKLAEVSVRDALVGKDVPRNFKMTLAWSSLSLACANKTVWDALLTGLGGEESVSRFPWEPKDNDSLEATLTFALGALRWSPRQRFAAEVSARQMKIGWPKVALQVRACVDCKKWTMTSDMIRQDVACDLEWLSSERRKVEQRGPYAIFAATESEAAAESIRETAAAVDKDASVHFASEDAVKFIHTSVGTHSYEDRLSPLIDWWLLGEADFFFSCGTSYSHSALGRRRTLPTAYVLHHHYAFKPLNESRPCSCADPGSPHKCPKLLLSADFKHLRAP
ncbi:hypothetical protein M885DRAFT_575618 [Pelagophyceae sp. CCMP2097]|nr:hypothetical protein M885DRAFT_575618 [Pelagophyceae sp. CCMP2097]